MYSHTPNEDPKVNRQMETYFKLFDLVGHCSLNETCVYNSGLTKAIDYIIALEDKLNQLGQELPNIPE